MGEKKQGWSGGPSLKNDRTDTADNHAVDIVADQSMSSETPEPSTLLRGKARIRSKKLTFVYGAGGGDGGHRVGVWVKRRKTGFGETYIYI